MVGSFHANRDDVECISRSSVLVREQQLVLYD
jgi:hypothetical protein